MHIAWRSECLLLLLPVELMFSLLILIYLYFFFYRSGIKVKAEIGIVLLVGRLVFVFTWFEKIEIFAILVLMTWCSASRK